VLKIARDEFSIDGLKASEVAKVLTDKFRLRTTRQRVGQVLDAAGNYVDRLPGSGGARYRVMQPGEDFLAAGGSAPQPRDNGEVPQRRSRTTTRRRKGPARKKTSSDSHGKRARSSKTGPRAALTELVSEGFFNQPRTITDARDQLRSKKGLAFKPTDLSPALVRMLRDGLLDRDRNESGTYEYRVP
jgi:hypothetical protein